MKAEKLDRVHVAVKDMDKAMAFFSKILGTTFSEPLVDDKVGIKVVFSAIGLELVESTSPDSAFARFIEKRGEGLFSLTFKVPDIEGAIAEYTGRGIRLAARTGSPRAREAQFHPKDSFGVSIVLTEYNAVHGAEVAGREAPNNL
ncbi:MAG: VOC family protein [Dehalococcoidia bacterium]|nr:VOC family protein [Dehalococcoidia bacterium]